MYFYMFLLILIDFYIKYYIECGFVVILPKWHVFVQKKIRLFQNSKFEVLEKSDFKGIFELKTVYFAYKPISDSLF